MTSCTPVGANSYSIGSIDTQTIFLNTLTTSTISKTYMPKTTPAPPDTLSTSSSAVNPHKIFSGTLKPGEHQY